MHAISEVPFKYKLSLQSSRSGWTMQTCVLLLAEHTLGKMSTLGQAACSFQYTSTEMSISCGDSEETGNPVCSCMCIVCSTSGNLVAEALLLTINSLYMLQCRIQYVQVECNLSQERMVVKHGVCKLCTSATLMHSSFHTVMRSSSMHHSKHPMAYKIQPVR